MIYDVIIIGSGPAGMTAAIYAGRARLKTLVVEGLSPGSLRQTPTIENYPGLPDASTADLMENMWAQAKAVNVEFVLDNAEKISLKDKLKIVETSFSGTYQAKSLIIATGSTPRLPDVPNAKRYLSKGLSTCALCDGHFYANYNVAVLGGGNTALEEALYLAKLCSQVTLIHRRDQFRAEAHLVQQVLNTPNIQIIYDTVITEFFSIDETSPLSGLKLLNIKSQEERYLPVQALFAAIGHTPETSLVKDLVLLDSQGYIITTNNNETSVPGIFAAGDIISQNPKQAIIAAGSGAISAIACKAYLINTQI